MIFPYFYDNALLLLREKAKEQNQCHSYLDSFEPFPPGPVLQSLDSMPTYKNDINESGIT